MAGRTGLLTKERMQTIVTWVEDGNYKQTAAAAAGIAKSTLFKWLERGQKAKDDKNKAMSEKPYVELVDALTRAEAEAERRLVELVRKAAITDARHAEWLLERRHPDRWGSKSKTEITGADGGEPVIRIKLRRRGEGLEGEDDSTDD